MTIVATSTLTAAPQDGFFARLRAKREASRTVRATMRELNALSDRDLGDIGISRCDIADVARGRISAFG